MRKKLFFYLFSFCSLILCTGCFDILEEINFKADGSGHLLFTINMSKSRTKLASMMLLDSVNGYKVPSKADINEALANVVEHLQKSEGITNIKQTKDFENYIFSISCDFENITSLNGITEELIQHQNSKEKTNFNTRNFSYDKSTKLFQRLYTYDDRIKKSFDRLKQDDRQIFDDASFTSIYRFEEPVKTVSNNQSKIAPSKKAVMLRVDAMSLILGQKSIQNKIQLTN